MARGSIVALVLAALLAAALPAAVAQDATPAVGTAGPRVVEHQTVDIPGIAIVSMSPDGRRFLGLSDDEDRLCGIVIATMAEVCAALETPDADAWPVNFYPQSVDWSPDGSRVAFTENGVYLVYEPDIWVFDLDAGQLTNLTDDGVGGDMGRVLRGERGEGTSFHDLHPVWSPDGQTIAFARAARRADAWTAAGLYRIAAAGGGRPQRIAPLPEPGAIAVSPELLWSADGQFLVYSLALLEGDHPANGLWVVAADGSDQRQLPMGGELPRPLLFALSPRGMAFVVSDDYLENPSNPDLTGLRSALVDVVSGVATPFDPPARPWASPRVEMLAFSPDGSMLLYVSLTQGGFQDHPGSWVTDERRLVVYDLDRGTTTVLLDPIDSWYRDWAPSGPVWGRNDLVFVPGPSRGKAILVRLAGDEGAASPPQRGATPVAGVAVR